jgi:DNA topoisomerase-2
MSNKPVKTVEEKFKKLDEISHVLLRPGRYIGSINPHTAITWTVGAKSDSSEISMVQSEITWCPALLKIFDEIISNSVDFSKTAEGKHVTTVKAEINKETGELSVYDDGGIVVKKHSEYDQYVPEMIFELRSGSNFDDEDDSVLTGQNGEGAALTSIFSKSFNVETCDGKKKFVQTHLENSRKKTEPKVTDGSKHYTKITFTPDYEKFGLTGLDGGNYQRLIKRVYDVAGCNPNLKVYLNGERIHVKSFEDYIKLYVDDFVFEENDHWKVGVAHSDDGFRHVSFVNGTETLVGGNHINYVSDQLTERLREHFKK